MMINNIFREIHKNFLVMYTPYEIIFPELNIVYGNNS